MRALPPCRCTIVALSACALGGGGGNDGGQDALFDVADEATVDARVDAVRDSSPDVVADAMEDVAGDTGGDTAPDAMVDAPATCMPAAGSLHIVEVMISSRSGSGDRGEWFEILNDGACVIDLSGLRIVSPTSAGVEKVHSIASGTVGVGQHFVLALSGSGVDNHLLPHDYVYGNGGANDVIFNNGVDWLELRLGMTAIDRVDWPAGGFTHGRTRRYPAGADVSMNDDWSRWCDAANVYSTAGGTFYGTPQLPDNTCP